MTIELHDALNKETLINSVTVNNEKLEYAIKELSDLGESNLVCNSKYKRSLIKQLKLVLHGLQT